VVVVLIVGGVAGTVWWVHSRSSHQRDQPRHEATNAITSHGMMTQPSFAPSEPRKPNRLIREQSPYLQQHAYNPVDWYPWGEEAFANAKQQNKPVFLSIGYSTCHWCHVMERESFEDPAIADLMNQWFINIKVDREELPDVDHVYMQAVIAMSGQGGWPLTVFLTPDLKPFFGGTYFPPTRRANLPGMNELLPAVANAWQTKREEIVRSASDLAALLRQQMIPSEPLGAITMETLHAAFNQAAVAFDPTFGGFGRAPKFPQGHAVSFLLHYWARTGTAQALEMAVTTLNHLARGGIRDHLGGGFHRYSTDATWLVPHFEKMLYDQALIARAFLEAYQVTRHESFAEVANELFEYVLRDMTDSQGAFYTAEDADSEGEEGKFYVWRPDEIVRVLGQEDGEFFSRFYGVTPTGNFSIEGGPHDTTILAIGQPLEDFAKLKGYEPTHLAQRLGAARATLLEARRQRIRPHRDDKILTSWNGLMIASLAYGGAVLDAPRYVEAAEASARFLLTHLQQHGQLLRRYRNGEALYPGTLEDYAFFSHGLLELYEATLDPRWLVEAKRLVEEMIRRFWDDEGGGFFFRDKADEPLIVQPKELSDGATPSGNSIAALVLLKLGRLTADQTLESYGRRLLEGWSQTVHRAPFASPQLLIAWDFALGPTQEIVIAGDAADPTTRAMLQVVHQRWLPRTVLAFHDGAQAGQRAEALIPYLKAQRPLDGQPTAYVCQNYICNLPVRRVEELVALLEQGPRPAALPSEKSEKGNEGL